MMRLKGKKAIVTGGAAGIGKAIASAFVEQGADVAIFDLHYDAAQAVAEALSGVGPGSACAVSCDVGKSDAVQKAFAQAEKLLGGLDILVNNAGLIRQSPIIDMKEEDWDFIIGNNLKSVFLCSQQAARWMIRQGRGGRIISISSIHAVLSEPNCGHYTAAKGGMESFCRTLATEVAPHKITVNYIRPGATFTALTTPMYTDAVKKSLFERVPLKEIAQPEWIAAGAVFLASDESRYMTGQHLTIDGGYVMDGSLPGAAYWTE
jgi:NAD(P)-dependent dehydrogenase (short-subunit alcohol dehydrogenase family)